MRKIRSALFSKCRHATKPSSLGRQDESLFCGLSSAATVSITEASCRIGVIHRPLKWCSAGPAPSLPFALAYARGAERQKTHLLKSAPCGAAHRVTGTRASRRSTAAIFYAATVLRRRTGGPYPHVIQAALALPFIRRVAAI